MKSGGESGGPLGGGFIEHHRTKILEAPIQLDPDTNYFTPSIEHEGFQIFLKPRNVNVCVLFCFIIPILGNRYGPGVNSLR